MADLHLAKVIFQLNILALIQTQSSGYFLLIYIINILYPVTLCVYVFEPYVHYIL